MTDKIQEQIEWLKEKAPTQTLLTRNQRNYLAVADTMTRLNAVAVAGKRLRMTWTPPDFAPGHIIRAHKEFCKALDDLEMSDERV